jgi:AraC-like DNA-binding protein
VRLSRGRYRSSSLSNLLHRGVAVVSRAEWPMPAPAIGPPFDARRGSGRLPLHTSKPVTAVDARVLSVMETVARNLDKQHLVNHLAAQLRLSPSRLEHLFKKETGQTIKAYVRAARLKKAKHLLQDPTLQIKEVAAAVGYSDASDFAHHFRKRFGQSPSRVRRPPRVIREVAPARRLHRTLKAVAA